MAHAPKSEPVLATAARGVGYKSDSRRHISETPEPGNEIEGSVDGALKDSSGQWKELLVVTAACHMSVSL